MTIAQTEGFSAFETWLGTPLPADPIAAMRTLRTQAEQEIERLLAFLDATDGEADLEEDDREGEDADGEPSLGWPNNGPVALDGEHHDIDAELDEADAEPSLASPEGARCPDQVHHWGEYVSGAGSQLGWARGNVRDLEGAADEDDEDSDTGIGDSDGLAEINGGEPSLGASEAINQEAAWRPVQDEWLGPDREREPPRPRLKKQTGRPSDPPRFGNVRPIDGQPLTLVDPDGKIMRIDADGHFRR